MSIITRFTVLFFALFIITTPLTFASSEDTSFAIPDDLCDALTKRIQNRCPPILCGEEGYYLRPTAPEEYQVINNETGQLKTKISDYFMAPISRLTPNCVFALLTAESDIHPVALRTPEKESEGLFSGELVQSFFDAEDKFLGIIYVEPHKTTGNTAPHINYYILKEHQGNKHSTPMISGFVAHLKSLEGKNLPQITLPKSANCLKILRNTLSKTPHLENFSILDIPYSLTSVGPIYAHIPLENPPSFVPASKSLFFTGRLHLKPGFSEALGFLVNGITKEETRAVGILLIFSSEAPDQSNFSPLKKEMMRRFDAYCLAKFSDRANLYPTLRDTVFSVVDEEELEK